MINVAGWKDMALLLLVGGVAFAFLAKRNGNGTATSELKAGVPKTQAAGVYQPDAKNKAFAEKADFQRGAIERQAMNTNVLYNTNDAVLSKYGEDSPNIAVGTSSAYQAFLDKYYKDIQRTVSMSEKSIASALDVSALNMWSKSASPETADKYAGWASEAIQGYKSVSGNRTLQNLFSNYNVPVNVAERLSELIRYREGKIPNLTTLSAYKGLSKEEALLKWAGLKNPAGARIG